MGTEETDNVNDKFPSASHSNPSAPKGYKPAGFSLPFPVSQSANYKLPTSITMTPRTLATSSSRSYVVMTPRAGDSGVQSLASSVPTPRATSTARTVKGAKTSAKEKSIFAADQGFQDRAVERRKAEKGVHADAAPETLSSVDLMPLDMNKVREMRQEFAHQTHLTNKDVNHTLLDKAGLAGQPKFKQPLARAIYNILARDGPNQQSALDPTLNKMLDNPKDAWDHESVFAEQRMVYIFNIDSRAMSLPQTMLRSKLDRSDTFEQSKSYQTILQALTRIFNRASKEQAGKMDKIKPIVREPTRKQSSNNDDADDNYDNYNDDDDNDMFPNAGEYTCVPKQQHLSGETRQVQAANHEPEAIFSKASSTVDRVVPTGSGEASLFGYKDLPFFSSTQTGRTIESEQSTMSTLNKMSGLVEDEADEYAACYPGVYDDAGFVFGHDEDDETGEKHLTKRQIKQKEKRKLDSQVEKVAKIMKSKD